MIFTDHMREVLDKAVPDSKIINDIRDILRDDAYKNATDIEINGKQQTIPLDVPVFVVTKAFFREYYTLEFGTYKVIVSLGLPIVSPHGIVRPEYSFATLYYDQEASLITVDFHLEMR